MISDWLWIVQVTVKLSYNEKRWRPVTCNTWPWYVIRLEHTIKKIKTVIWLGVIDNSGEFKFESLAVIF